MALLGSFRVFGRESGVADRKKGEEFGFGRVSFGSGSKGHKKNTSELFECTTLEEGLR